MGGIVIVEDANKNGQIDRDSNGEPIEPTSFAFGMLVYSENGGDITEGNGKEALFAEEPLKKGLNLYVAYATSQGHARLKLPTNETSIVVKAGDSPSF
jgi:hypothetical protein